MRGPRPSDSYYNGLFASDAVWQVCCYSLYRHGADNYSTASMSLSFEYSY